jgi:hypothetical protein
MVLFISKVHFYMKMHTWSKIKGTKKREEKTYSQSTGTWHVTMKGKGVKVIQKLSVCGTHGARHVSLFSKKITEDVMHVFGQLSNKIPTITSNMLL